MSKFFINLLASFVFIFCTGSLNLAKAQEYNFHVGSFEECENPSYPASNGQPPSILNNTDPTVHKMVTEYLDLRYNAQTKLLTIEAQFNNTLGNLPTGFHFALSKGPRPQGFSNLAAIYFDAKTANNIKVLGYAYNVVACNCANYLDPNEGVVDDMINAGSWLTAYPYLKKNNQGKWVLSENSLPADPIFTSLGENVDYVIEKLVKTTTSGGITKRTFRLVLNTTQLNQFVPKYLSNNAPYNWEGTQFAEKLGLRFWAVNANNANYNQLGYFSNYQMGDDCSVCGYDNVSTNTSPICKSVSLGGVGANNVVKPGGKVTAVITAYDKEKDNLRVNYTGQPSGSNFSVANNAIITPNANGDAPVNFDWIPNLNNLGSYKVDVKFTQQYGQNKAHVTCPLEFTVAGCDPIDWRQTINTIDDDIAVQLADKHVKKLVRRIKNTRGSLSRAENEINTRAGVIGQQAWEALMGLQRNKIIRQDCGGDVPGCESIDTTRVLNLVSQITVELFGMVETLAPRLRKALTKNGITGKQNTRRWRPVLNSATRIKDSATVSINSLPAVVYACEQL